MPKTVTDISRLVGKLSLEECLDEIAFHEGWKRVQPHEIAEELRPCWPHGYWDHEKQRLAGMFHPIWSNIETIHSYLPNGFVLKILHGSQIGDKTVLCTAWLPALDCKTVAYEQNNLYSEGDTELLAAQNHCWLYSLR